MKNHENQVKSTLISNFDFKSFFKEKLEVATKEHAEKQPKSSDYTEESHGTYFYQEYEDELYRHQITNIEKHVLNNNTLIYIPSTTNKGFQVDLLNMNKESVLTKEIKQNPVFREKIIKIKYFFLGKINSNNAEMLIIYSNNFEKLYNQSNLDINDFQLLGFSN